VKSIRVLCVLAALSCFSLVGCGDDNSNDSGGNADLKAAVASCEKLCDAQEAKKCESGITISAADCKQFCQIINAYPASCAAKWKAYADCTDKQADACTAQTSCSAEQEAANSCK
jgi:hypothetical protein